MALAWAVQKAQEGPPSVNALLQSDDGDGSGKQVKAQSSAEQGSAIAQGRDSAAGGLPDDFILVLTQVLPDGMGVLIFGENAVRELSSTARIAWVRCYTNDESV